MSDYLYGKNSFTEALRSNRIIKAYVVKDSPFISELNRKKVDYEVTDRRVLDKMSHSGNHQGCLAEIKSFKFSTVENMLKKENGLIVVLDGLKDPHNLGAIIRTCECAGVDGLIYKKNNAVRVNDTVSKVSSGALEYVKISELTNITATLKYLKEQNYWIVGSDARGDVMYNNIDYNRNVVLVIGSEGEGVSRLVLKECDYVASLPMFGQVNSLNASVAAGILIYNVLDKRK